MRLGTVPIKECDRGTGNLYWTPPTSSKSVSPMTKQAIICVDDEDTVLRSLKAELKNAFGKAYLIEIAEGGEEALELVEELLEDGYEIPLVISDYIMPEMKGDELLKRVHQRSPKTLKIMLTGQASLEGVSNAIQYAKLYRYLSKPWQGDDLRLTVSEAIHSYLQEKKLSQQHLKLLQMNHDLEELTQKQADLIEQLKEKEYKLFKLNQAYERFVPRQFLDCLQKKSILDVSLGDQVQAEMSVLFSDIRDFTTLSESMTPAENFKFINSYLSYMEPAILENRGFIDKYIGDAIMAIFSGSADDAIKAGIAMLKTLNDYNKTRQSLNRPALKIGIGINTGLLMLGTVGGQSRMDGTVISDSVNLASRMEGLTKKYGVPLLISHETFLRLHESMAYHIRAIDRVQVQGKSQKVSVFEVFDADPPELRDGKAANRTRFEQGLVLYRMGDFREAEQLFTECLQTTPQDTVAQIYWKRCQNQG